MLSKLFKGGYFSEVSAMQSRRHARRLALQILFANEFLRENVEEMAPRILDSLEEAMNPFTMELVKKTWENEETLNQLIRTHLKDWDFNRIAVLDKVLIRMALCEILYFPDIPVEVSINEALEICKEFGNHKSRRFINGILDSIYKELKAQNKILKDPSVQDANSLKDKPFTEAT